MGNALSCFDNARERPANSLPKDHPSRNAAIADNRRRRNMKVASAQVNASTDVRAPSNPSANIALAETNPLKEKVAEDRHIAEYPPVDKPVDVSAVDNKPPEIISTDNNATPPNMRDDDMTGVPVSGKRDPAPTITDDKVNDVTAVSGNHDPVESPVNGSLDKNIGDTSAFDTELVDEADYDDFEDEPRADRDAGVHLTPAPDSVDEIQPVVTAADVDDDKADKNKILSDPTVIPALEEVEYNDDKTGNDRFAPTDDEDDDDEISVDNVEKEDSIPGVRETEVVDVDIGVPPSMVDSSPKQMSTEEVYADEPVDNEVDIEDDEDEPIVEPAYSNDIIEKSDDAPPVPEDPVDGATAAHDVQEIMNGDSPKDEDHVIDGVNLPSIDTRRALFDHAEDHLPEVKEVTRDVLDPVTNEYTSLEEYRRRQRERAQGVVRERVEKFEEIDDARSKQIAEHAAIEAARAEAIGNARWTFKSKPDMKSPGLSTLSSSSAKELPSEDRSPTNDVSKPTSDEVVLPSELFLDSPTVNIPPIGTIEEPKIPPIGTAFPPVDVPVSSVDAVVDEDSLAPNDNISQIPPPPREPVQVPEFSALESKDDRKEERLEAPLLT